MASIMQQAKEIRAEIDNLTYSVTDDKAKEMVVLFPLYEVNKKYKKGDRFKYHNELYKVLQDHTSQAEWTPDTATSLYVKISDPTEEWPQWIEPSGAHDAYPLDAKVSHKDKKWISTIDNNVWEPGVYGWVEYKEEQ